MRPKSVDFNALLMAANLTIAALGIVAFVQTQGNEYVNQKTIVLGNLLASQTHVALLIERRRRDPFVVLLAVSMIFYYLFRVLTLTLYPVSLVFTRFPFNAADANYALIFIIAANTCLYFGLFAIRARNEQRIDVHSWAATAPVRVIILMVVAIAIAYSDASVDAAAVPRAFAFLSLFIAQHVILLMALSYYILFRTTLSNTTGMAIVFLIATNVVLHTLLGSRGEVAGTIQSCLVALLAIGGCIKFRRSHVVVGVLLLPALAVLLVASFALSTYNRAFRNTGAPLTVGRSINLVDAAVSTLNEQSVVDRVLPAVFSRAGFFDFSAEIIAHRREYASVLNFSSYGRSIVDNILTPGFDIYDQPKIANALQFAYGELGEPSKERLSEDYQSDQLGIYGEAYALFGYAALPVLFFIALGFKGLYVGLRSNDPFRLTVKRVVVLFVFVRTVDSFGTDWTMIEALQLVAMMVLYSPFFSVTRRRVGWNPPAVRSSSAVMQP